MILYLHGFASSSNSAKAELLKTQFDAAEVVTLDLPYSPFEAVEQIKAFINEHTDKKIVLMGSSLGGYYALYISNLFSLPAILINPSMRPYETLAHYVGVSTQNYTKNEHFVYQEKYIDFLRSMDITYVDQRKILLMLQRGDETLDYRVAQSILHKADHYIEEGGNHSFENFERSFPLLKMFYERW